MVKRYCPLLIIVSLLFGAGVAFAVKSPQLTNPMRPIEYQPVVVNDKRQESSEKLQLTAVLISAQRSVVVINGKTLQRGDKIGGYRVVKIETDKVLLKKRQKSLVLRRAGTGLKKMSPHKDIEKVSKP